LFGLPTSSETISEYNWINQSLIEFKINIKDIVINLFSNKGNPGNPGNTGISVIPLEIARSISSEGLSTVTPNSPIVFRNVVEVATQTLVEAKSYTDTETQTLVNGLTVGRSIETINVLADVLDKETTQDILEGVDKIINNITD